MHFNDDAPAVAPPAAAPSDQPWWRELNRYQWFVFLVASLGWLFDTMDQQLFNLARKPAVTQLIGATPGDPESAGQVAYYSGVTTCIFMLGWATGGIFFGVLGDKVGRAKTMMRGSTPAARSARWRACCGPAARPPWRGTTARWTRRSCRRWRR